MPKAKTSLEQLLYDLRRIEEHRATLTEKKIHKIYKSLTKDLLGFLGETYTTYSDKDGRLYLAQLQEKSKYAKFLEEIASNVDSIAPEIKEEIMKLVESTYEKSYKGMLEAIEKADSSAEIAAITKDISVPPEVIKQAVNNNISKLSLPHVLEKNRQDVVYDIQQTINIGLMNGDRYETMAKKLTERLGVSYNKATNIVRTESHRNIEGGLMDGAKAFSEKIEGSNVVYAAIWKTMKDERVRPSQRRKTKSGWKTYKSKGSANHQKMEGVIIKVGDKFKLETNVYAEAPGLSGTARNDCRCRCFLTYEFMTAEEFAKATGKTIPTQKREKPKTEYMRPEGLTEKEEAVFNELEETYNKLYQKYGVKVDLLGDKLVIEQRDWDRTLDFNVNEYLKEHPKVGRKRAETYVKKTMYPRPEKTEIFLGGEYWDDGVRVTESGGFDHIKKITVNRSAMDFDKTFKEGEEYIINKMARNEERVKKGRRARSLSNVTEGGTGTLLHEYGHAIDYAKGVRDHPKFKEWYSTLTEDEICKGLSTYASTNEKEFIAEAFAESFYSYQRPLSKKFMEILEEILNDKTS